MSSYWAGVATPFAVAFVGGLVYLYADTVRRTHIGWKHDGCGGTHEFRPWLPRWIMRRTFMPVSVWRCNRGQSVPLLSFYSGGRDRSNDPEDPA